MYLKNGGGRPPWSAAWRAPVRALLLGGFAAVAAGLFGAAGGAILCLADGLAWGYAADWGLRGAFAGLTAGAVVGAFSAFHHVEERRPRRRSGQAAPGEASLGERPLSSGRPAAAECNGVRPPA